MKNFSKYLIVAFTLLFSVQIGLSNVITAVSSGNWNTPTTWDQGIPADNDHVIIPADKSITISQTINHNGMNIELYGVITLGNGRKIDLDANSAIFIVNQGLITGPSNNGSKIIIGGETKWNAADGDIPGGRSVNNTSDPAQSPLFETPLPPEELLPVEFIYFNAQTVEGKVELNWATASEINNDYFEIQRSNDGENWRGITEVNGAVNSLQETKYSTTDDQPLAGANYYRLKQVDIDGSFSYSKVVVIKNQKAVNASVYPNPSTGRFNVALDTEVKSESIIKVYNAQGQLVHKERISSSQTAIDLTNQVDGVYAYHIENENNTLLSTGMLMKN